MKNDSKKFNVSDSLFFKDMPVKEGACIETNVGSETLYSLVDFEGLVHGLGLTDAVAVLRTLEVFEGINENTVSGLSYWDRYDNVIDVMQENSRYQTSH